MANMALRSDLFVVILTFVLLFLADLSERVTQAEIIAVSSF